MLRSMLTGACFLALAACATGYDAQKSTTAGDTRHMQDADCTKQLGVRTSESSQPCGIYGRTYSKGDLDRTGEVDVGDALQKLDPSITVHH